MKSYTEIIKKLCRVRKSSTVKRNLGENIDSDVVRNCSITNHIIRNFTAGYAVDEFRGIKNDLGRIR